MDWGLRMDKKPINWIFGILFMVLIVMWLFAMFGYTFADTIHNADGSYWESYTDSVAVLKPLSEGNITLTIFPNDYVYNGNDWILKRDTIGWEPVCEWRKVDTVGTDITDDTDWKFFLKWDDGYCELKPNKYYPVDIDGDTLSDTGRVIEIWEKVDLDTDSAFVKGDSIVDTGKKGPYRFEIFRKKRYRLTNCREVHKMVSLWARDKNGYGKLIEFPAMIIDVIVCDSAEIK